MESMLKIDSPRTLQGKNQAVYHKSENSYKGDRYEAEY